MGVWLAQNYKKCGCSLVEECGSRAQCCDFV